MEFYFLTRALTFFKWPRSTFDNLELLKNGLPGALVAALILGVHELSHLMVAKGSEVKLGVPYFVPSWQVKYIYACSVQIFKSGVVFPPPPLFGQLATSVSVRGLFSVE